MKNMFFTVMGVTLILIVASDIHRSILHSRGRNGPLSESVCRLIWLVARRIAFRLPRPRRHPFLNYVGPLLMPVLIVIFVAFVMVGFASIYYPRMPSHFAVDMDNLSSPWLASVYFSGITLTTVGYGDIVPRTMEMRMTVLVESASGFGLISLAITYLIAVYSALQQRSAAALTFYHHAEGSADATKFISHHFVAGRFSGLGATLRGASRDLQEILELHIEHPIIRYFHPIQVYRGLPRILFLSLEICTVIKACVNEQEYPETYSHPEVLAVESTARHVLGEFLLVLHLRKKASQRADSPFEQSHRWQTRYEQTIADLEQAGVKTRSDLAEGWKVYSAHRDDWEASLYQLASYLGYDWDEVTGDRDPQYAADETIEEPRVDAR